MNLSFCTAPYFLYSLFANEAPYFLWSLFANEAPSPTTYKTLHTRLQFDMQRTWVVMADRQEVLPSSSSRTLFEICHAPMLSSSRFWWEPQVPVLASNSSNPKNFWVWFYPKLHTSIACLVQVIPLHHTHTSVSCTFLVQVLAALHTHF